MEEHRPKKLLDQVRDAIRLKHSSYRTKQAYVGWIKRYIYFPGVRHPSAIGSREVEASRSVTHLALAENVAASTQNQGLSALLFLYREVLHQDLGPVDALRAKRLRRLPTVLIKHETLRLVGCLSGTDQLMAKLIYGSGLRLMECLRLRVKNLESDHRALIVRNGKGAQDRVTLLPDSLIPLLNEHLQRVKALHEQDLARGYGAVCLPAPPDGITMFKQMSELGWTPKFTLMIRAPENVTWAETMGAVGDYVTIFPGWHNGEDFPGVDQLNAKYQAEFGRPADLLTGPAYACVQIAAAAIEKAGTLDRDAIRDAIAATNMTTVTGPVTFNPDGTGKVLNPLIQWQKGKLELVWPAEHATAEFAYPAPPFDQR